MGSNEDQPSHEPGHSHTARWISRTVPAGHARARRRRSDFASPGEGGARRHRRRPAGRSDLPARRTTRRSGSSPRTAPRRCRSIATARRTCWPRRSRTCFPASSAASVRRPTKASSTTSSCRGRSCPKTSRPSSRRCANWRRRISSTSARCGRARRPKAFFAARGEPLKVQLIDEKTEGQREVSCYTIKDKETFIDFCVGPHVPSTGRLKAFKLLTTSNAYWKGDARNQPMQRVYGTAFFSEKELKAHLTQIEEAKKRDHRKLGASSGCSCSTSGRPARRSGWTRARRSTTCSPNYMRERALPRRLRRGEDAARSSTRRSGKRPGHWSHYRQNMFLIESEGEQMGVKAMNCPGHMLVFASEMRSYRDLPIRFHEQTPLHRNEASGVLSGLTRVRQFSQDDAHCFVTQEQIGEEVERLLRLVQRVYGDFGLPYDGQAVDASGRVPRRGRDVGLTRKRSSRPRSSAPGSATRSTRATARSTGRRSTSTSPTRSAANGSARRFSSTTSCRSAST